MAYFRAPPDILGYQELDLRNSHMSAAELLEKREFIMGPAGLEISLLRAGLCDQDVSVSFCGGRHCWG